MTERFTQSGLNLTLTEVCEVLDFWDRHCTGLVPRIVSATSAPPNVQYRVRGSVSWPCGLMAKQSVPLTRTLIEYMRDWAYPWQRVEWEDIKAGEWFRPNSPDDDLTYQMGSHESEGARVEGAFGGCGPAYAWVERSLFNNLPLFARRLRVERVRLRDVANGADVRAYSDVARALDEVRDDDCRAVLVGDHDLRWWHVESLVEIVEEPHE